VTLSGAYFDVQNVPDSKVDLPRGARVVNIFVSVAGGLQVEDNETAACHLICVKFVQLNKLAQGG